MPQYEKYNLVNSAQSALIDTNGALSKGVGTQHLHRVTTALWTDGDSNFYRRRARRKCRTNSRKPGLPWDRGKFKVEFVTDERQQRRGGEHKDA